jgi:enolase-phosphatase E1
VSSADSNVLLLDIEGTTTPISFVHEQLFGYARAHLDSYVFEHWDDESMREVCERLSVERRAEGRGPLDSRESVVAYFHELMAADRKSPGFKLLQGLIWEDGYNRGELRGEVWDDVPAALRRWRAAGKTIAIYSSGSELAQRLLFQSTRHGDLTKFISAFFDTRYGAKVEQPSYRRIADALNQAAASILFVSDVTSELRAAQAAGMRVLLSVRPGNPPQTDAAGFPQITTFDDV